MKKVLSIVLCVCMLLSTLVIGTSAASPFASGEKSEEQMVEEAAKKTKFLSGLVGDVIIGTIAKLIPNLSFVHKDSDDLPTDNYYEGNEYMDPATDNMTWQVGYDAQSIIPDDFGVPFKYARGSYAPWGYSTGLYKDDDGNDQTMMVRTVLLDDGTGRGLIALCSVDCIGISNVDVKKIREGVAEFAKQKNIVSVDVSSIHSHQAIDSQGVWNNPLSTVFNNFLSITGLVKPKSGVNKDYLNTIIERTALSIENAYKDLKPGRLYYTDIELEGYINARSVSHDVDGNIHKLAFVPDDENAKGTVLASFGCHPEVTSYGNEFSGKLSADYVYYMDKLVRSSGSNFIFIQGNVGTNSCGRSNSNDGLSLTTPEQAMRFGYEMAYITLGAEMTTEQRKALNDELGDKLGVNKYAGNEGYTVWYDGLETYEAKPVEAVMNVRHELVKIEMDNTTSIVLLKLGLASNYISYNKAEKKYYTVTEVGYLQLGTAFKAFFSPGELYSELVVGGFGLKDSPYKSLQESYGDDVFVFDLMNDAIGYVCPDERYAILSYIYDPTTGEIYDDSWCMTVSIGKTTASSLIYAYESIMENFGK